MVHFKKGVIMPERKFNENDKRDKAMKIKMRKIGYLLKEKRLSVSSEIPKGKKNKKQSRAEFIEEIGKKLFDNEEWISIRYLSNIESGHNLPSIEMLIKLSVAFETDPIELFESIYNILKQ